MLDSLLKSKFYTKCKTNKKLVKTRLEAIKKKKNAVQKFLKNDIADLLRNGHDMNAFGRAEGLLIEQNMACCYELIDNFCGIISNSSNLSLMQKQKECPEEFREAVASLIYAAARFADLPELRDLRNIFTERYGNSLQVYTNQEFMERLSPRDFTKEMKLQLLQDIANENSIQWNSKALEQKLFTPPTKQDQVKNAPLDEKGGEKDMLSHRRSKEDGFARRRDAEEQQQGNRASNARHYNAGSEASETDGGARRGMGRYYGAKPQLHPSSSEDESSSSTVTDLSQDNRKTSSSSAGSVSEDDTVDSSSSSGNRRPFQGRIRPPPYLKLKPEKNRFEEEQEREREQEQEEDSKPKPRSVRRRNDRDAKLPPPPGHDYLRRRGASEEDDEEEKAIDGLLLHYSNKRSPREAAAATGEPNARYIRGRRPELAPPPGRAASLPPEPTVSAAEAAESRGPVRAASFQPDGHTHPKLPGDYDELAARIAALRGK